MKDKEYWIIKIFVLTFALAIIFSTVSNIVAESFNNVILFIILILVILIGIFFDAIGVSAITADDKAFHAMSSKKIKGSKEALNLIKNSNKISSICNDVIGDICGIVSGGIGAVLAISLSSTLKFNSTIISIFLSAFISSFTVGGKAVMKKIALKNSNKILYIVGKFLNIMGF